MKTREVQKCKQFDFVTLTHLVFLTETSSKPTPFRPSLLMKITINSTHSIALWRWNLSQPKPPALPSTAALSNNNNDLDDDDEEEDDDDDDDVCGICRVAYDGCCPDCKTPGDECPLSELARSLFLVLSSWTWFGCLSKGRIWMNARLRVDVCSYGRILLDCVCEHLRSVHFSRRSWLTSC